MRAKQTKYKPMEQLIEEDDESEVAMSKSKRSSRASGDDQTELSAPEQTSAKKPTKRSAFVDKCIKQRSAMGDYIVPEGGKPLTNSEASSPGPAAYLLPRPSLTMVDSPEWFIATRFALPHADSSKLAPNVYELPDEIVLKNKFTLRKRLKPNKKVVAGPCRRGPTYKLTGHEIGMNSFQFSVPRAPRNKVVAGPPNTLVQPDDTPGFKTPAAEQFSMDGVRPHSFHTSFTTVPKVKLPDYPGPNVYKKPELDPGQQKTFGFASKNKHTTDAPPPNTYNIETLMGTGGPAYSMRVQDYRKEPVRAPSPCAYLREREYGHKEETTMGYRLPTPEPDTTPAPNVYKVQKGSEKLTPWCSLKSRVPVSHPARVHSAFAESMQHRSPGPAKYNLRRTPIRNLDTGASIKKPFKVTWDGPRPGPSDYGRVECDPLSSKPRAPAFSMRPVWKPLKPGPNPGPAAYKSKSGSPGLAASMKSRPKPLHGEQAIPSPSAYNPRQGCTRFGPCTHLGGKSMSSRHSPMRYLGLKLTL